MKKKRFTLNHVTNNNIVSTCEKRSKRVANCKLDSSRRLKFWPEDMMDDTGLPAEVEMHISLYTYEMELKWAWNRTVCPACESHPILKNSISGLC